MQTNEHRLAGALLLAQEAQRPYLRRNFEEVIDSDEKRYRNIPRLTRCDWSLDAVRLFETNEMSERLSPKLRVSVTQIATTWRTKVPGALSHNSENRIGVRNNTDIIDIRARLIVDIFSRKKPFKIFAHAHRIVRINGSQNQDGKFRLDVALTDLEKPILFSMDRLLDDVSRGSVWREAMRDDYSIIFTLEMLSQRDERDVLAMLAVPVSSTGRTILTAKWDGLPRCPLSDNPIPLFAGAETTRYVLHVQMSWMKDAWLPTKRNRPSTPLEAVNDLKRVKILTEHCLPTPAETPQGSIHSDTSISVHYRLGNNEIEKRGLRCFLCGGREYESLARLLLHLTTNHPNLTFDESTSNELEELDGETNICIEVGCSADRACEKRQGRAKMVQDFDWNGPRGLGRALYETKCSSPALDIQDTERQAQKKTPKLVTEPRIQDLTKIKLELPRHEQFHIEVPGQHPYNGCFFSTDRTPLKAGEVIQAEEVADHHMKQARRAEIGMERRNLHVVEQQFLEDINDHLDEECSPGTVFLGGSIRRWVHKRRDWLVDERMRGYLEEFMQSAEKRGYISRALIDFCMKAAAEAGEGDSMVNGIGNISSTQDRDEKIFERTPGQCICGKPVKDNTMALFCSHEACENPDYHANCIDVSRNLVNSTLWICPNCKDEP